MDKRSVALCFLSLYRQSFQSQSALTTVLQEKKPNAVHVLLAATLRPPWLALDRAVGVSLAGKTGSLNLEV